MLYESEGDGEGSIHQFVIPRKPCSQESVFASPDRPAYALSSPARGIHGTPYIQTKKSAKITYALSASASGIRGKPYIQTI